MKVAPLYRCSNCICKWQQHRLDVVAPALSSLTKSESAILSESRDDHRAVRARTVPGLDVAYADPVWGDAPVLPGVDFFERYGMEALSIRGYPPATHLAEKLHASRCRGSARTLGSRTRSTFPCSLTDGADADELRAAIALTFEFRGTHPVPTHVPDPPQEWFARYAGLQASEDFQWTTLHEVLALARLFVDPALSGVAGRWSAATGTWR